MTYAVPKEGKEYHDYEFNGTKLAIVCEACKGTKDLGHHKNEFFMKDHDYYTGPMIPNKCYECAGYGYKFTDAGLEVIDFVSKFMKGSTATGAIRSIGNMKKA